MEDWIPLKRGDYNMEEKLLQVWNVELWAQNFESILPSEQAKAASKIAARILSLIGRKTNEIRLTKPNFVCPVSWLRPQKLPEKKSGESRFKMIRLVIQANNFSS